MKLMPLLVLAIYFVVVSTGYPNPLNTTKVDNVKDRGCSGWAGGLGKTCNSARSAIGEQCCPAGAACKWERLPNGVSVGKCRKLTEKEIEAKKQETECECLDFMNGAYGNCKKLYKYNWKYPICYISDTACCEDKKWSSSAGKYYSARACGPKRLKTCD